MRRDGLGLLRKISFANHFVLLLYDAPAHSKISLPFFGAEKVGSRPFHIFGSLVLPAIVHPTIYRLAVKRHIS